MATATPGTSKVLMTFSTYASKSRGGAVTGTCANRGAAHRPATTAKREDASMIVFPELSERRKPVLGECASASGGRKISRHVTEGPVVECFRGSVRASSRPLYRGPQQG